MSVQQSRGWPERFVAAALPWLVAAGGFLVYLGTLNAWVSLSSLATVARVSGWLWRPELHQPLTFLVLYPFRFLPEAWIPLALNLFAAACAAGVLLLLAHSVALLPQDRTHEQRKREPSPSSTLSLPNAWMPPVLAALACGLQLTFWEHATSVTGEMINLLVFAGVIGCLLEFRIAGNQAWLSGSAFLYGAGMTNDWTMIGYWPIFLAAVLWLKGLSFFNPRFLLRMALWGMIGLSLYLVLPAVQALHPVVPLSFWAALKANLKAQRDALIWFPKAGALALSLTCLLPLLVISIRWKSQGPHSGDDNPVSTLLTKATFHFAHAAFLAVSLWIALDPPISPRKLGLGAPLLTQYYLSALVIGYCAGYFLLIGSVPVPKAARNQKPAFLQRCIAKLTVVAFWILLAALPLMLVWRNLDQVRATNGPALRQFARQLCGSLPAGKSVVLSDDPRQLFLVMAELAARRHDKDALLLDTASLAWSQYHIVKAAQFKSRWPAPPPTNGLAVVEPGQVLQLISRFSSREPVFYLHPSFSGCFELFADRPNGAVHGLVPRTGDLPGEALDSRAAAANEQYWEALWAGSLRVLTNLTNPKADDSRLVVGQLAARLSLVAEQNPTAAFLGGAYAKSLNDWGVRMQRLGRWKEAGLWFGRALELKPDNLPARINLEFNGRHQQGNRQRLDRESMQQQYLDLFAEHRTWEAVINDDGPVDEPTFLFETGRVLLGGGKPRQAVRQFARCAELAPDWREPQLWLAQGHVASGEFASALVLTDDIQAAGLPRDGTGLAQFLFCRANALEGLGRTNEAATCIESFITQYPEHADVLAVAAQLYLQGRQYQPALAVLDRLLDREPQNPELLSNKGLAELQLARYAAAITTLTTALALAPSNQVVRLNRAIACLRAGELEAARADYQQLFQASPRSYKVVFGLGEIAWRRQDTNAAIRFYQQCLALGLPASPESKLVAERLRQLKGDGPK
jgi:tetratricopeptide (TPR) repeat protein